MFSDLGPSPMGAVARLARVGGVYWPASGTGLGLAGGGEWDCRQEPGFCRVCCYLRDRVETPPFFGIRGTAACP